MKFVRNKAKMRVELSQVVRSMMELCVLLRLIVKELVHAAIPSLRHLESLLSQLRKSASQLITLSPKVLPSQLSPASLLLTLMLEKVSQQLLAQKPLPLLNRVQSLMVLSVLLKQTVKELIHAAIHSLRNLETLLSQLRKSASQLVTQLPKVLQSQLLLESPLVTLMPEKVFQPLLAQCLRLSQLVKSLMELFVLHRLTVKMLALAAIPSPRNLETLLSLKNRSASQLETISSPASPSQSSMVSPLLTLTMERVSQLLTAQKLKVRKKKSKNYC